MALVPKPKENKITMKNYKEYIDYCQSLAEDVNDSYSDDIDINDLIHQKADGNEYTIYYGKAWDLVNMMRLNNCELLDEAIDEVQGNGFEFEGDIHAYMTWLAYFLIRHGIYSAFKPIESEVVA